MIESGHELLTAVRAAIWKPDPALVDRIDAAIVAHDDPDELGTLHLARALAHQGSGDGHQSAASILRAIPYFVETGRIASAAHASAVAAVFVNQIGNLSHAIDLAVDALMMLAGLELADVDSVRASLALCGFFFRMSAFELACETGKRAFDEAVEIEGAPMKSVAYTVGWVCAEAGHVATDPDVRDARLAITESAADWLVAHGDDDWLRVMIGGGLHAEIALATGHTPNSDILTAGSRLYDDVGADLVAWHRMVRATAAERGGEPAHAVELLDEAIPDLLASADHHCLVRALTIRGRAHAALGDLASAYADATRLAELTRGWQIDQVGRLAEEFARRVDLEIARDGLLSETQQLSHDLDHDPTTGVHSRYWLERRFDALEGSATKPGAVMMIDVDSFKSVNDRFGHPVGDVVLARIARLLESLTDGVASIARYGGEEFIVIGESFSNHDALDLAERMRRAIQSYEWDAVAPGLALTISIGISHGSLATIRSRAVDADQALMTAKRRGRNCVAQAA